MLSVILDRILNVQIVYSVQLNCTGSNYIDRQSESNVECVTVQNIECTDSVHCSNEVY